MDMDIHGHGYGAARPLCAWRCRRCNTHITAAVRAPATHLPTSLVMPTLLPLSRPRALRMHGQGGPSAERD
eukprot:832450-Prymnesium_polylepis.1